jgi:hypothetical protein
LETKFGREDENKKAYMTTGSPRSSPDYNDDVIGSMMETKYQSVVDILFFDKVFKI